MTESASARFIPIQSGLAVLGKKDNTKLGFEMQQCPVVKGDSGINLTYSLSLEFYPGRSSFAPSFAKASER